MGCTVSNCNNVQNNDAVLNFFFLWLSNIKKCKIRVSFDPTLSVRLGFLTDRRTPSVIFGIKTRKSRYPDLTHFLTLSCNNNINSCNILLTIRFFKNMSISEHICNSLRNSNNYQLKVDFISNRLIPVLFF